MIIKSVDIENFGNFKNKHFDFNEGINNFIEDNGWGKSTLSSFIKAMFYGLDERGTRRKSDIFVERERYLPWSGGKFGGSLVFSKDGKDYKIRRFFDAKKSSEDTFSITDMATNKETKKYSQKVGEELFGINKESFERSCFVTLDESKTPELNDDISGKLNNILQAGDDIGNCQNALKAINDTITSYSGRGKGAKTSLIKKDIEDIKSELLEIDSFEKAVPKLESFLEIAKKEKLCASEKIKKIEKEKENILLFEKKKHLLNLQSESEKENSKKKEIEAFFNGNIPEDSVLENLKNEEVKYVQSLNDSEHNKVTDEDRESYKELNLFFDSKVPSNEEIENCQNLINEEKDIKADLSSKELSSTEKSSLSMLKNIFSKENINEEVIKEQFDYVSKVGEFENNLALKENEKKALEEKLEHENNEKKKKGKKIKIAGIASFILFAVASVVLFVVKAPIVISIILSLLSLISLSLGLVIKPKENSLETKKELLLTQNIIEKINSDIANYKNSYETFIKKITNVPVVSNPSFELSKINSQYDEYKKLLSKEDEYLSCCSNNKKLEEVEKQIKDFVCCYVEKCNTSDTDMILSILRNKKSLYDKYSDKIPRFDSAIEKQKSAKSLLDDCLKEYRVNKTLSYEKQIDEIKTKILEFNHIVSNEQRLSKEIEEFTNNNDVTLIMNATEGPKSASVLEGEIEEEKRNEHNAISNINSYQDKIDNAYAEIDKKETYENKKEVKERELKEIEKRVSILNKTAQFLDEAKENLSTKYMGKMESAFSKYLNTIDENKDISIDNSLNVKVEGEGEVYDRKFLSEGYKDIVNFCTRLALVDAMFEDEKPLLVLDDPFVNLDKEKIENALDIVKKISEDKQVVYFTCHDSRKL